MIWLLRFHQWAINEASGHLHVWAQFACRILGA